MSNSSLVTHVCRVNNYTPMTNKVNRKITIHHMAGNLSLATCDNVFGGTRQASANYAIDSDGRVGLYVDEKNRAWTSSSYANDSQAVTIEVANDTLAPNWTVSDKAMTTLILLCVDICKRNGIPKLVFTGDQTGTLTYHYMFANTACPGPYIKSKTAFICNEVNKRLQAPAVTPASGSYPAVPFVVKVNVADLNIRKRPEMGDNVVGQTGKGAFTIVQVSGDWGKLKSGAGWIYLGNKDYCTIVFAKESAPAPTLKVGSSVKIKSGAKDLNTKKTYASFVYSTKYVVKEISGSRVVFGTSAGVIIGAVDKSNVILA